MSMAGLSSHNDVLSAVPEDDESRQRLVGELKSRGNASFKMRNMPVAEELYSKAISHDDSLYALWGNRSATRLALGKFELALSDADRAIAISASWGKGYLRRAQALSKLRRWSEAEIAANLASDVANKSSEKEGRLMAKQITKLMDEMEKAKAVPQSKPKVKKVSPPIKPPVFTKASSISPTKKTVKSSKTDKNSKTGDESFRGYKVRADGSKTSFFDTQWDEQTKALYAEKPQGPVKIDASENSVDVKVSKTGAAAWNSAGTYEECDMTKWAKDKLHELLKDIQVETPLGLVKVKELKNVAGDATCPFTCMGNAGEGVASGSLKYPEVTDDTDGDFECELGCITGSMQAQNCLRQVILGSQPKTLNGVVQSRLRDFVTAFNKK